jgi:hypothetical protein
MALAFPPIPAAFLSLFGPTATVIWENPSQGLFGIIVCPNTDNVSHLVRGAFTIPDVPPTPPTLFTDVVETDSVLQFPEIPVEDRCTDPPLCLHGSPSVRFTVHKKESPNLGRVFYVCSWNSPHRCGFFRWADELEHYSNIHLQSTLTAAEVRTETAEVRPEQQLDAWNGVKQGTDQWHKLRACRVTASNFGSVHMTNTYSSPSDLLRSLLWPAKFDSRAMRYGSLNEKVALGRFSEYLSGHAAHPDLPMYLDEPGIWLCSEHPYLAGSPDGVLYETIAVLEMGEGLQAQYFRCRRSLIEIKTPYKLRTRDLGAEFYASYRQRNGRNTRIPCAYYDQIQGNMHIMGLGYCYFIVLAPTGYQVILEPYDPIYTCQSLLPSLQRYWFDVVLPAFDERDRLGKENVFPGWLPSAPIAKRKREPLQAVADASGKITGDTDH